VLDDVEHRHDVEARRREIDALDPAAPDRLTELALRERRALDDRLDADTLEPARARRGEQEAVGGPDVEEPPAGACGASQRTRRSKFASTRSRSSRYAA
jgi:hypothetical protein